MKRMFAILLALCLLLSGCARLEFYLRPQDPGQLTDSTTQAPDSATQAPDPSDPFADLPYTRPDPEALQKAADKVCKAAESRNEDRMILLLTKFYDKYNEFYTMLSLADIHYSLDLTDETWAQEYQLLLEQSTQADKLLDDVYTALADSPIASQLESDYFGEGFLESYRSDSGEPDLWTEQFVDLLTRESNLISQYYEAMEELPDSASSRYCAEAREHLGPVLLELVALRREIAEAAGYPDYESFAWDNYYVRDYTPKEVEDYLQTIREEMVPLYTELWGSSLYWQVYTHSYTPQEGEAYLASAAKNMGGSVEEAWELMTERKLYDIQPGRNKYPGSFEVYLTSFSVPYLFLNPCGDITDLSSFAHEFGHFANDYAAEGSQFSADVAEVMSQGMEFLAACYAEEPAASLAKVRQDRMASSLSTFVEQAAYYTFEKELYALEDLTLEAADALYDRVAREYGFDAVGWETGEWATVPHYYTQPFYILGYVVSADGALQLYQREKTTPGAGLARYKDMLPQWEDYGLVTFLEENDLKSPFEKGHLEELATLLKEELGQ